MVHPAALDPHLIEANHVAVHGLPLATTRERWWRCLGDGVEHSVNFDCDLWG